jgi:hypothetical protein
MTHHDLLRKINDVPFKPFRIRLSNQGSINVLNPGSIIVGKSSAVVPTAMERDTEGYQVAVDWKTISIGHIVEMININARDNGSKHRRKS